MIISQLSISAVGKDVSLSKYVKIAIDSIKKEGIKYQTNAMATVIETEDLDVLFSVVKKAHNALISAGVQRVITELKIDDRKDKNITIENKIKSVQ